MKTSINNTSRNIFYSLMILTTAFFSCKKSTQAPQNPGMEAPSANAPIKDKEAYSVVNPNSAVSYSNETTPGIERLPNPNAPINYYKVNILGYSFNPAILRIQANSVVVWTNNEKVVHSIISDNKTFESAPLRYGESYSYKFLVPGTYKYSCGMHDDQMSGTIIVTSQPTQNIEIAKTE